MPRPRRRIAELADLRRETLELAGETVVLVEPAGITHTQYRRLLNGDATTKPPTPPDRRGALAFLIQECTQDEDGAPFFTPDEALTVAGGRSEVFTPLVAGLLGMFTREKKLSTQPNGSTTGSPSGSAAPSGNSSGDAPPMSSPTGKPSTP